MIDKKKWIEVRAALDGSPTYWIGEGVFRHNGNEIPISFHCCTRYVKEHDIFSVHEVMTYEGGYAFPINNKLTFPATSIHSYQLEFNIDRENPLGGRIQGRETFSFLPTSNGVSFTWRREGTAPPPLYGTASSFLYGKRITFYNYPYQLPEKPKEKNDCSWSVYHRQHTEPPL